MCGELDMLCGDWQCDELAADRMLPRNQRRSLQSVQNSAQHVKCVALCNNYLYISSLIYLLILIKKIHYFTFTDI